MFAKEKTTLKFCRKERRGFEWTIFIKWKISQHTLLLLQNIPIAKHTYGKVWNFFPLLLHFSREKLFIISSSSLKFPVGQSRKFLLAYCLTFFIVYLIVKEIQNVFWRINDREKKFLTLYRTYFLRWVVKTAGVANHRKAAKRSFTIALNNLRV